MDILADELQDWTIASLFIYTHEAHPGKHFPHHTTFEQKLTHAREFQRRFNVRRPILVDSLDGACHRAYGSMPNMCWIIDRRGRPVYKANWTDVHSIKSAVHDLFAMVDRRKASKLPAAPFEVERLEYRPRDHQAFLKALEIAGPPATKEYTTWKSQQE